VPPRGPERDHNHDDHGDAYRDSRATLHLQPPQGRDYGSSAEDREHIHFRDEPERISGHLETEPSKSEDIDRQKHETAPDKESVFRKFAATAKHERQHRIQDENARQRWKRPAVSLRRDHAQIPAGDDYIGRD